MIAVIFEVTPTRAGLFTHYRLRVAAVMRDYGLNERHQAPF